MKKYFFENLKLVVLTFATLTILGTTAFTVFAQPGAAPTGGNVNATFDSIHSNSYGTFATDVATGGNVYPQGYLENNKPGANILKLNDTDGVQVTAGSAYLDVETQIQNNQPGQFVYVNDAEGMLINNLGIDGNSNIQNNIFGTPVRFNDIDGVNILVGPLDVTGVIENTAGGAVTVTDPQGFQISNATAPGTLRFLPSGTNVAISNTGTGERVWISDSEGLDIRGPIRNWGPAVAGIFPPLRFDDNEGIEVSNGAGTVGLNVKANGDISNAGPDTSAPGSDDEVYSQCTLNGKTFYFNGAAANELCTKPVKIAKKGLDVDGSIINTDPNIPLILSDKDGIIFSGDHDGILWVKPDGANGHTEGAGTGITSISNENGDTIAFNGADKVWVGSTAAASPKLQIDGSGYLSNPATPTGAGNNYGQVTIKDSNGLEVDATGGFSDGIDVVNDNGMVFYGTTTNNDGMYVGTYSNNKTGITADSNYPGSTAFYGYGGDRVLAGQSGNVGIDVEGDNAGVVAGTRSTGTAVMGQAIWSSPGPTWPGGGVGGRFEAYKGIGVIGQSKDSGQAGKFYYLTTATGGLENNRTDISTPSYSVYGWGPIRTQDHMSASNGFGRIYTVSGSATTVAANTYAYAGSASCSSGQDRVLSCSFSTSSNVYLADTYPSSNSCTIYVKNTDTVSHSVTPKVTCIDPNSTSW